MSAYRPLALGLILGAALAFPPGTALFLALASVLFFLIFFLRPAYSLWLVVAYVWIDYLLRSPAVGAWLDRWLPVLSGGSLAGLWDELLFIAIVGAWLFQMAREGRWRYTFTGLDIPILLFIAAGIFLLLIRSPETHVAVEGLRQVVEYIFWFFLAANLITSKEQVKGLTFFFLFLAFWVALYGVWQYYAKIPMPPQWVDQAEQSIVTRSFSIIGSPNILGSLMILAIPVTSSLILAARRLWQKGAYTFFLMVFLLCLLYSFSRGAWLALAGAMVFYGILRDKRLLALLLIGLLLAPVAVPSVVDRISYLMSDQYLASSEKGGRLMRWEAALVRMEQSPLVGVGLGRFGGATADRNRIPGTIYADNYYLKTGAEMGIIGLSALLGLLFLTLRYGTAVYRRCRDPYLRDLAMGITVGLLALILHNGVENVFEVPMMLTYFWFMAGMLAAINRLDREGEPEPETPQLLAETV